MISSPLKITKKYEALKWVWVKSPVVASRLVQTSSSMLSWVLVQGSPKSWRAYVWITKQCKGRLRIDTHEPASIPRNGLHGLIQGKIYIEYHRTMFFSQM